MERTESYVSLLEAYICPIEGVYIGTGSQGIGAKCSEGKGVEWKYYLSP
jgi:hypothetical protein